MNGPRSFAGQVRIECPACHDFCLVSDPEDACVYFHECECCGVRLRPVAGDCCVICSYGVEVDRCAIMRS